MARSLLYVVAGSAAAWVGVDLLYHFLRFPDSYGRIFPF
jgi:hypothetical protein